MKKDGPSFDDAVSAARTGDEGAIRATFEALGLNARSREVAWEALGEVCERATSGQSVQRGAEYFEREIRQLGPVVAWREARVTEQRSLGRNGPVQLRVMDSGEQANAWIESELDAAACAWGYRPAADELADLRAHHLERERLLTEGNLEALEAYCRRHARRILWWGRDGRAIATEPWTADMLLEQAAPLSDDPRLFALLFEKSPSQMGLRNAAVSALRGDRMAVFDGVLSRLEEPDAEFMGDTLLALAVRLKRPTAVGALLERNANPNGVWSAFAIHPPFARCSSDGNGPMVNAVREGDPEILRLLLSAGGDPLGKTAAERRVLDMAREIGDASIVGLLEDAAGQVAENLDMDSAIATGNVDRVRELLAVEGSARAIQQCAQSGNANVLRAVLASGADHDPGALAKALWYGATNGHLATVELLLAHRADPNGFVQLKKTARAMAQDNHHTAVAALLEKAGGTSSRRSVRLPPKRSRGS
jgi:hypothetical protein